MEKYIVRESDNMVFNIQGEPITAKTLTSAKRAASRKQFFQGTNLRLEYENGELASLKKSGENWVDYN